MMSRYGNLEFLTSSNICIEKKRTPKCAQESHIRFITCYYPALLHITLSMKEPGDIKLLLINPWIYDFAAYDLWSKPLGLLYIGAWLRSYGFNVEMIDCLDRNYFEARSYSVRKDGRGSYPRRIIEKPKMLSKVPRYYASYGITEAIFRDLVNGHNDIDAVLVTSMMTYWYPGVVRVVDIVRELLVKSPIILGGIYATILPDHALENVKPDHIITGSGEIGILHALNDIFDLRLDVPAQAPIIDELPQPAYDLYNSLDYAAIMTTRGCPLNCAFCAQNIIAPPFQKRSVSNVVEELLKLSKDFDIKDYAFYDDALFVDRENHIKPLLREINELDTSWRFHTPNGLFARMIDDELAFLLRKSGFATVRLSFETSNEARRREMDLKVSNDHLVRAIEKLANAGYKRSDIEVYVLMGLPKQPKEEVIESIDFVHKLGATVRLASYSPIHRTADFEKAVECGLIDQSIDPLLTNKTIYTLAGESEGALLQRELREYANKNRHR